MNLYEASKTVRRRMGIITISKSDIEWLCKKIVCENQKVFDALA